MLQQALVLLAFATPAGATGKVDFATQIRPIFESRCYECHGETKQKGKLRLDRRESVFAPKNKDPRIVAGQPDASPILALVSKPKDDPDVMPAEGDPLTAEQVALIRDWIAEGAQWPEDAIVPHPEPKASPADASPDRAAPATRVESAALGERTAPSAPTHPSDDLGLRPLSDPEKAAEDGALARIAERGGLALRVSERSAAVEVNLALLGAQAVDGDVELLAGLEPDLVWLNLARTSITDSALPRVGTMTELRKLNLSNTKVSDSGLAALAPLSKLEYLNLYGTSIGDTGIAALAPLPRLRNLYLWQTAVTDAGVAALQRSSPALRIDRGVYAPAAIVAVAEGDAKAPVPVNASCPVSGKAIDPAVTSEVEGQLVGFCCANCKAEFDKDPAALLPKVQGFVKRPAQPSPLLQGRLAALEGGEVDLASLAGRVVLVVNVASRSGYSRQLGELETLRSELKDRGFEVLAVPCDDFGGQEPGDAKAIADFARRSFKVTFPLLAKQRVRAGESRAALLDGLAKAAGREPDWNFCKYLILRDGTTVRFFPAATSPDGATLRRAIEEALAAG